MISPLTLIQLHRFTLPPFIWKKLRKWNKWHSARSPNESVKVEVMMDLAISMCNHFDIESYCSIIILTFAEKWSNISWLENSNWNGKERNTIFKVFLICFFQHVTINYKYRIQHRWIKSSFAICDIQWWQMEWHNIIFQNWCKKIGKFWRGGRSSLVFRFSPCSWFSKYLKPKISRTRFENIIGDKLINSTASSN